MEVSTDQSMALRAVAEVGAQQLRAVHARGFLAGHRAAERKLWPVIVRLTMHVAAQLTHCEGLLQAAELMFRLGYGEGAGQHAAAGVAVHANAGSHRGRLRLIKG